MQKSPTIKEIEKWLVKENPLGLFDEKFSITNIDPKKWSGHFDYLIKVKDKKYVLRFKGSEWGEAKGIVDEYNTLKKIEEYAVGPKVYYLSKEFFDEPMLFEEHIDGITLDKLSSDESRKIFPKVAKFIYKINSIPFQKDSFPFQEPMTSYVKSKNAWKNRLGMILDCTKNNNCGHELLALLPTIESKIDEFEDLLQRVIKTSGSAFIFESAHIGHCVKVKDDFRFFNWEQVSYGDPSFTLAVFLTSIKGRDDFEIIKKEMIKSYLEEKDIPQFAELLGQRMWEREISNTIYSLWSNVRKNTIQTIKSLEPDFIKDGVEKIKKLIH